MIGTIERARGRWPEILTKLGVEARFLSKRKKPCPVCGGHDRFRFDDREEGWYFCNACGPGPGQMLLRKLHGWTHATVCAEIDKIIGKDEPPPRSAPRRDAGNAKAAAINRLLAGATDQDVVDACLQERGITAESPVLIGHRACQYFDDDGVMVGAFPAVLAPIVAPDGTLVSVQRIWRKADVGEVDKKPMPPVTEGALTGAAVRLVDLDAGDRLGVAEGVMTALAAHELFGQPTWALLSANNMRTFNPPNGIRELIIYGDCDHKFVGQAAAYELARRMSTRPNPIECTVCIPEEPGTDWNDELQRARRSA